MGCCISSEANSMSSSSSTAKVISINGDLHEYPIPIKAFQVLVAETDSPPSFFLCNSDKLYLDKYIPPLHYTDPLQLDQLYFLLPIVKLQYSLTSSDMASLAAKATAALLDCSKKTGRSRRKKQIRITPIVDLNTSDGDGVKTFHYKPSMELSRSGSMRKLQRNASRRLAKIAYRSFRARLSTIYEYEYEGSVPAIITTDY